MLAIAITFLVATVCAIAVLAGWFLRRDRRATYIVQSEEEQKPEVRVRVIHNHPSRQQEESLFGIEIYSNSTRIVGTSDVSLYELDTKSLSVCSNVDAKPTIACCFGESFSAAASSDFNKVVVIRRGELVATLDHPHYGKLPSARFGLSLHGNDRYLYVGCTKKPGNPLRSLACYRVPSFRFERMISVRECSASFGTAAATEASVLLVSNGTRVELFRNHQHTLSIKVHGKVQQIVCQGPQAFVLTLENAVVTLDIRNERVQHVVRSAFPACRPSCIDDKGSVVLMRESQLCWRNERVPLPNDVGRCTALVCCGDRVIAGFPYAHQNRGMLLVFEFSNFS